MSDNILGRIRAISVFETVIYGLRLCVGEAIPYPVRVRSDLDLLTQQAPMRILFLHQNFPAQFLRLALALKQEGEHELVAVVPESNRIRRLIPTRTYRFDPRQVRTTVPLANHYAGCVARGEAVAGTLRELRNEGFRPDVVIGHGGWGETLFVRDVWPDCRIIVHAEFHYSADAGEVGFDPEFPVLAMDQIRMRVRTRNAVMTQALLDADQGVAPTQWQWQSFPPHLRERIIRIHEGIDTDLARPNPRAEVRIRGSNGDIRMRAGDEVVTFVNRNLEPHRGYHIFMRALPRILAARPQARAVIVGGDETSYGPPPPGKRGWRDTFLDEVRADMDPSRVHFVGRVPYPTFLRLMQVTAAHVYLTYPFVLSWSLLEAMSAGALVIGSRTGPVEEAIEHGRNGVLCDFFDVDSLVAAVTETLERPQIFHLRRAAARDTVIRRFDLRKICLPTWLELTRRLNLETKAA